MRYPTSIQKALACVGVALVSTLVAACGGGSSYGDPSSSATDAPAAAAVASPSATAGALAVHAVERAGDPRTAWGFDPQQISIRAGDSISFTDAGKEIHTFTADDGSFDTGTLSPGEAKSVVFDHAGSFSYHCSLHPWMTGTVIVTQATASSSSSGSSSY
jgi:plastocyanin